MGATNSTNQSATTSKRKVGFALLDPETMRQVAAAGGRRAHATGRAHRFNQEEARAAALKSVEKRRAAQQVTGQ